MTDIPGRLEDEKLRRGENGKTGRISWLNVGEQRYICNNLV
jgi:hypothetical protein